MWKTILDLAGKAVSSATSGITIYLIIGAVLIGAGGSGYVVYKVEHARVELLQADLKVKSASLDACMGANKTNEDTIFKMSRERDAAAQSCEKRLNILRKQNADMTDIDNLGKESTHETTATGDAVLDRLNVLFFTH